MRKMIAVFLTILFLSGFVYAEAATDEMTIQELSALRKKLGRVKREMDLMMKDIVSSAATASDAGMSDFGSGVSVDILQNDKNVVVKADLPGMEKDKINITLERNRLLKISGTREMMKSEKSPGVVRQERFYGNFEKIIELPCEVENSPISAVYQNGVLEITIPKRAAAKEDMVKISVK